MGKKDTLESFIKKANIVHGGKYVYDSVNYVNSRSKVDIFCPIHNYFFSQKASAHLSGRGCPKCGGMYSPSTEEFVKAAIEVHGIKYTYERTVYIKNDIKAIITCKIHGDFLQTPRSHLDGRGCNICNPHISHTTESYIEKAVEVHGDEYGYDKVVYVRAHDKIIIYCNTHKEYFEQEATSHLRGAGCPKCGVVKYTTESYIEKAVEVHGTKYKYDKTVYTGNQSKITIYCEVHKEYFEQTASAHLYGNGCPKCGHSSYSTEDYVIKARESHGDRYGYDKVVYVNSYSKIMIYCNVHKEYFEQSAASHLQGSGCPKCTMSKGEIRIYNYLIDKQIEPVWQQDFDDLVSDIGYPLRFDFSINLNGKTHLIEYDGIFHYSRTHASHDLEGQRARDKLKDEYCLKNNIPLLRIHYRDFDRIEEVLDEYISRG